MSKVTRFYTGPDNKTHFEDLEIPTPEQVRGGTRSEPFTVTGMLLRESKGDAHFLEMHPAPRRLLDPADDAAELLVGELAGGRQLHVEDALLRGDERLEFLDDVAHLGGAALLDQQPEEVARELVRVAEHALEHVGFHARVGLGVRGQRVELGHLVERGCDVRELCADGLELAALGGGLEERARVDSLRRGY